MTVPSELAERLRAAVSGDPSASAWLYDTFAGRLYRRLQRRYGRAGLDAEDLLQDAFVFFLQHDARVLRRFLDQSGPDGPTTGELERYLWDLACGLASNRRRSRSRATVVPLVVEQTSPTPGAERSLIERDQLDRLLDCLRRAGSRIFLYFKLRFDDGLSPRDIATATGWSMKATYKLRQRLDRAVVACREALGSGGELA